MYTISQVSSLLSIPTVTLRAWEQRYGVVCPSRTDTGYRIYSADDVESLRWLKDKLDQEGLTISQAVQMLKRYKSRSSNRKEVLPLSSDGDSDKLLNRTMEQLLEALLSFRTEQSRTLIDLGFSMYGYDSMICRILVPMLLKVGDEWEAGRISVAQEHFITQFVSQRCYGFFQMFPIDPQLPRVLAFCPAGEEHHMGLLLFSLFLRQKGIDVIYLGANTPEDGLNEIISGQKVDIVCLSVMDKQLWPSASQVIDHLQHEFPKLVFVLGGQGLKEIPEPYASWRLHKGTMAEWHERVDALFKKHKLYKL